MTENETKGWLEYIGNMNLPYDRSPKNRKIACDTAIQALEEIQQYRAIGTVEELQKLKLLFGNENVEISELITKILKEYPEYLSIGTVEEFKALKEKNEPKKVVVEHVPKTSWTREVPHYLCPCCNHIFSFGGTTYCSTCGQKLDWKGGAV